MGAGFIHASRALSMLAAHTLWTCLAWDLYTRTRDPLLLGYFALARLIPILATSPIGGMLADRFDRRRVAAIANVVFAVATAVAILADGVPALFVAATIAATARGLYVPPATSMIGAYAVARRDMGAIALGSALIKTTSIAGPLLGGALASALGASAGYLACTPIALAAALCSLAALARASREEASEPRGSVLALFRDKLGAVMLLELCATLFGGATALLPVLASDYLGWGGVGLGILRATIGIAAVVTGLYFAAHPPARPGRTALVAVIVYGAATMLLGATDVAPVMLIALAVIGAADVTSTVARQIVVQTHAPPAMRGRVSSANQMIVSSASLLGELESGATAALLGVPAAIVAGGGLAIASSLALWRAVTRRG